MNEYAVSNLEFELFGHLHFFLRWWRFRFLTQLKRNWKDWMNMNPINISKTSQDVDHLFKIFKSFPNGMKEKSFLIFWGGNLVEKKSKLHIINQKFTSNHNDFSILFLFFFVIYFADRSFLNVHCFFFPISKRRMMNIHVCWWTITYNFNSDHFPGIKKKNLCKKRLKLDWFSGNQLLKTNYSIFEIGSNSIDIFLLFNRFHSSHHFPDIEKKYGLLLKNKLQSIFEIGSNSIDLPSFIIQQILPFQNLCDNSICVFSNHSFDIPDHNNKLANNFHNTKVFAPL